MPTSLGAGCGRAEGRPKKCQPLSMVTLIMSKFSLVGAERGFRSKWRAGYLRPHGRCGSPSVHPMQGRRDTRAAASAARTGAVLARVHDRAGLALLKMLRPRGRAAALTGHIRCAAHGYEATRGA